MIASVLGAGSAYFVRASGLKQSQIRRTSFKSLSALGWALLLEAALIAGGIYGLVSHPAQSPEKVIPITIETTAPEIEKPPEPEKPKPIEPLKPILPPPLQPPLPQPKVIPLPVAQLPVLKEVPDQVQPVVTPTPLAPVVAAPVPVPAPTPPPPPAASSSENNGYHSKVKAAAQAALEVPGTVSALRFKGRTRVSFNLKDGIASGVTIVQSSGLGAMDRAATKAVQSANYPQPPAALQGKDIGYEIWVTVEPEN